jgi:muramidase (phage lysozyme)
MDSRALATILAAALVAYVATAPEYDANGETDDGNADLMDYAAQAQDAIEGLTENGDEMNKTAFLAALRLGEGTDDQMGFWRLCGGGNMSTLADHPAKLGWGGWRMPAQMAINAGFPSGRAVSTAAGAYQITRPTWDGCASALGLVDFSEASQDAAAWYLIGQKGAKADVLAGRIQSAIYKLRNVWASLPGAAAKQRQVSLASFASVYMNNGGVMA